MIYFNDTNNVFHRYFLIFLTFFNILLFYNCFTSVWFIVNENNTKYKKKNSPSNNEYLDHGKEKGNVLNKEYMALVVILLSILVRIININYFFI